MIPAILAEKIAEQNTTVGDNDFYASFWSNFAILELKMV